jgi:hypothetical protein
MSLQISGALGMCLPMRSSRLSLPSASLKPSDLPALVLSRLALSLYLKK